MAINWIIYACLAAGLASALVAGVFMAFSEFVMKALIAAKPISGIEAMQQINRKVFRTLFLVLLLALAPISLALGLYAQVYLTGPGVIWITSGAAIYVSSVFLVTMFGNVPMNNRLEAMDFAAATTANYWRHYGLVWTRWNHVRTLGSFIAALCFLIASLILA